MKWVQYVKLYLTTKSLRATIEEATSEPIVKADKANDMSFIRRHMHDALQTGYLSKRIHALTGSL